MTAELTGHGYRSTSYWLDTLDGVLHPRPALAGDREVDVAIIGAGYTGLWTAYYLAVRQPSLRVAILEREIAGYGASGRNGGWCSALFPQSVPALARRYGPAAALALHRTMRDTVDEVGRVTAAERIDCDFAKGGTVVLARGRAQLARARAAVTAARELGLGRADLALLDAGSARGLVRATRVLGGTYTPHCAAIHPGKLVRGLATAVERRGVTIYERSPVVSLRPGAVVTASGTVRAEVVVRATEGWTTTLPGHRRALAPVYSLMVATPPLPAGFWDEIGLSRRETFADFRHLVIYGQRTADDRFAFGGRGAPYHFGSRVRPGFDREPQVFAELRRTLADLFPALGPDPPVTHAWGGPLGVPRDWHASVGLDRPRRPGAGPAGLDRAGAGPVGLDRSGAGTAGLDRSGAGTAGPDRPGLAWAGGYVGDGVGTANLAGRTLADLIGGQDSELTALPWVGHRSRRWEPEPLRWLGVNAALRAMSLADAGEARTGRPSRLAAALDRLVGS